MLPREHFKTSLTERISYGITLLKTRYFIIVLLRNIMAVAEFDNICIKCFKAKLTEPKNLGFNCPFMCLLELRITF